MLEAALSNIAIFLLEYGQPFVILSWVILATGLIQNFIYGLQLPFAFWELREHSQAEDTESPWQLLISDVAMPISVLVPAYNEEVGIVENVHSLLSLKYASYEVIVVNDGSTDRTLDLLIEAFSLKPTFRSRELSVPCKPIKQVYGSSHHPHLIVVDKENGGGKADASNAAINFSRNPLFCVVDADSLLEPDALLRSVRPFMEERNHMIAVGGTIRILNGCKVVAGQLKETRLPRKSLPLIQSLEYIRSFLMSRLAFSRWGMLTIISGAFGIFNRNIAIATGGFSTDTVGEDYDLVLKMHRHMIKQNKPYSMRYVPEPVCWTEAPETLKDLASQRKRWQRGALEVFFKNRGMLLNPRNGRVGMLALVNHFIIDVMGPIAEMIGYILIPLFWSVGLLNTEFMLAFISTFFLFGVFISICSLTLEEMELRRCPRARDLLLLALVSIIENFGYRQLNNFWRIQGWWLFLRGKNEWEDMSRSGAAIGK